jgi:hypothetical protein
MVSRVEGWTVSPQNAPNLMVKWKIARETQDMLNAVKRVIES